MIRKWLTGQMVLFLVLFTSVTVAEVRDGRLFDPGIKRHTPAENAPPELAKLTPMVGDWQLALETWGPEGAISKADGKARVTFMNRGHALMERTRIPNFDGQGNAMPTIAFWAPQASGVWTVSEGNGWNETIQLFSGAFDQERLVVNSAMRPGGGTLLLMLRRTMEWHSDSQFTVLGEQSTDQGQSWTPSWKRTYTRTNGGDEEFFPVGDDTGSPDPHRPDEAAAFDFLLGEFDASHWMPRPQGIARWPSNATATFVLDGKAILEFDWHEQDSSLPDAATTILRMYNRSMRRWENLFLTNRSNTPLYFGGVREGDRIVLHPFDAQTGSNPMFQWIFFDVRDDAYRWKGLRSVDRGTTWSPHWAIEFQRKGSSASEATPDEVMATANDGVKIFGDHYRSGVTASPTVVLFHQAGGDARGEFGGIARRLVDEGFEVFAWDARSGGDRFGQENRTVIARGGSIEGYCGAYPDLVAGLQHAFEQGSGGPIYAVGSSYSAALVIRLAAEYGNQLAGVAPFSPASGRMEECAVGEWLPKVKDVNIQAFRPLSEMENESAAAQALMFEQAGVPLHVVEDGRHGASMLNPERSENADATWTVLLEFLNEG